ncbi:class I SAM-dependent DNA methyltransferase [Falsibacillus pallidus]|uniref:site-specific DNA-methyltransferase (adenine-specific) n=1 Tax=Falsibacillus pallidus TaxID=493781 RepID=A0A370G670_9BACI|nr:DNA methyltransferase [Falsibacillus pallidus]RDI37533.1 type II restriction/modification system DNA methylase subunit YeeA [Falsibacillus pallidus]
MAIIDLQDRIIEIVNREDQSDFLYDLLDVYDIPKATITRLKNGNQNLTKSPGEVHLKNKIWFKQARKGNLFDSFVEVEKQVAELSAKPRYVLVTDFGRILAKDTKTQEALDIKFEDLPQYFDFFLAWKGIEKVDFEKENPADIKAAERFARLYDVLRKENSITENYKGIDLFLIRLLFCFFAEDTDIFKRNSFTNPIKTLTEEDGSDLNKFFTDLFIVLDKTEREGVPSYLKEFPFVNGQLFTEPHEELKFSSKSRKLIIECGELLNWAKINPDIFGSMIQAVATEESRSHLGMHYTSVPNIMKVIKPLFLDELYEAFEKAYDNMDKLNLLYERIGKIKFFDPACGSGNFLIITYKELRRLEIKILLRQRELSEYIMYLPSVTLDQFYGIEIDDFAHDVAKLSLWIAEHQMNMELEEIFNDKVRATLPLQSAGEIRCANALRVDWNEVCPYTKNEEVYIFGNPPYLGSKKQNPNHKEDLMSVYGPKSNYKQVDYIAGWFQLAANYIKDDLVRVAFVSTNSICQGEQVELIWKRLLENTQISFAYTSFKWNNNAKKNAGVTVIVVGLDSSDKNVKTKRLYIGMNEKSVKHITPYLTEGEDTIVSKLEKSISGFPKMDFGSMPRDGGGLIFSPEEREKVIESYPELNPYIWRYIGADEFINNTFRYCLWLNSETYEEIKDNPIVRDRMEIVRQARLSSKAKSTQNAAKTPYSFVQRGPEYFYSKDDKRMSVIVPAFSSENRFYVPIGIEKSSTILSNKVYVIPNAEISLLGILSSRMHMTWMRAVAGRLETRYGYSSGIVYNTFPFPSISTRRKQEIEAAALDILDIREELGGTLAELYDQGKMPMDLKLAHEKLDSIVERAYRQKVFETDEERLEALLKIYQEMLNNRSNHGKYN